MSRDVEVTDVFHYNDQFHNKMVKLKIGTISAAKESEPAFAASRIKVKPSHHPSQSDLSRSVRLSLLCSLMSGGMDPYKQDSSGKSVRCMRACFGVADSKDIMFVALSLHRTVLNGSKPGDGSSKMSLCTG